MWKMKTEYDTIRMAITYAGGKESRWFSQAATGDHPIRSGPFGGLTRKEYDALFNEFEKLKQLIKRNTSAKVLDLKVLLQETLDNWRGDKKKLRNLVSTCFPEDWSRVEKLLGDKWMDLTAGEIFGEKCPMFMEGDEIKMGIRPVSRISNTGDLGHMTPAGFIVSRRKSWVRSREDGITKAIFENHPDFVENVNILPAFKGDAFMEGGDVMCLNEDSMAVGIRSSTNREAAVEISRALPEKRVYAVLKYPEELRTSWTVHYGLHLNYMFSMVDEGKALVAPYVFDYPKGSKKTLMNMLKTLSDDLYKWEPVREESDLNPKNWPKIPHRLKPRIESRVYGGLSKDRVEAFRDVGKVEIYKGGKLTSKKDSFIQALIEDEVLDPDGVTLVGGDPGDIDYRNEFHHWITSIREGGWACCVLTVKPGIVVAYYDMFKTNEALEDHGVKVITMDPRYIKQMTGTGFGDLILPLWRSN